MRPVSTFGTSIVILGVLTITGCGSGGGSPAAVAPSWSPPASYAAAAAASRTPSAISVPVGPWDCQAVDAWATPGSVISWHHASGDEVYTADANGIPVSARGTCLSLLSPPTTTLWFTITVPPTAMVTWSGFDHVSVDATGGTYTVPASVSPSDPAVRLTITVELPPAGGT